MDSHEKEYIVLSGDLKASKDIDTRSEIQEKLKDAVKLINGNLEAHIVTDFSVTAGDNFQGMLATPSIIFELYYLLYEKLGYPFYLAAGIGKVSTELSDNVGEIDGPAFYKVSEALNKVKKGKLWFKYESGQKFDSLISASWNLVADKLWDCSPRQRRILLYYRRNGENRDAILHIADELNISERAVYKSLKNIKYKYLKSIEKAIKENLTE